MGRILVSTESTMSNSVRPGITSPHPEAKLQINLLPRKPLAGGMVFVYTVKWASYLAQAPFHMTERHENIGIKI